MKYMISSKEKPNNHPIHAIDIDLESLILYNEDCSVELENHIEEKVEIPKISDCLQGSSCAEKQE